MSELPPMPSRHSGEIAVADLLDRALHKGLVIWGEATISVAGIDLVYLGLKLLLTSTDTVNRMREAANATPDERHLHAD